MATIWIDKHHTTARMKRIGMSCNEGEAILLLEAIDWYLSVKKGSTDPDDIVRQQWSDKLTALLLPTDD